MRTTFILLITLSFSFSIYASYLKKSGQMQDRWSPEMRQHFSSYYNPLDDAFLSTIMGVCGYSWPWKKKYGDYRDRNYKDTKVEDRVPVKMVKSYSRDIVVTGKIKKVPASAPLLIFLPGMFNEVDDSQNKRFLYDMSKRGHHVAVLPNPLSSDFISAKPNFKPGAFLKEAEVLYRLVKKIVTTYKTQGLLSNNEVRLVGVSYGALMSAIITGLDADDANIITKGTTLISPPLNFRKSLARMDQFIDDSSREFAGLRFHSKLFRFLKVCFTPNFKDRLKWAKGMTIYSGFQELLVNSINVWREIHNITDLPYQNPNWEQTFKFSDYLGWYAPDVEAMLALPEAKLEYWVDKARVDNKEIRILSADDDWLNTPDDWADFHYEEVLLLENGGHFGFRKLPWFDQFLTIGFPIR